MTCLVKAPPLTLTSHACVSSKILVPLANTYVVEQAKNLGNAKKQLATVTKDLEFIKDSITTTEVRH